MHVLSAFWYLIGQLFDAALQPRTTKNGIKYLFNEKVGHVFAGGNGWLTNCEDTPHSHCAVPPLLDHQTDFNEKSEYSSCVPVSTRRWRGFQLVKYGVNNLIKVAISHFRRVYLCQEGVKITHYKKQNRFLIHAKEHSKSVAWNSNQCFDSHKNPSFIFTTQTFGPKCLSRTF